MLKRGSAGFTLVEALVALAIATVVVSIPLIVLSAQGRGFARESARTMHATQIDNLIAQLESSAHTSVAIYTPVGCGPVPGDDFPCSSVRFYGLDSNNAHHFWGWDYNAAAKTLTQCLKYAIPQGACTNTGAVLQNVLAFTATPRTVTDLVAKYPGIGATVPVEKVMLGPNVDGIAPNRVVAGNRVVVIQVGDAWVQREKHLVQGGAPFSTAVLKGSFTPPTLGSTRLTSSQLLWFWGEAAASLPATATQSQYSQYEPALSPPWWTVSAPASCAVNVAVPVAPPSDTVTLQVSPNSLAPNGACAFSVSSQDGTSSNGLTAYVAGAFMGSYNGSSPSTTLSLGQLFQHANDSASVQLQKTFDPNALAVSGVNWNPSTCASLLSVGAAAGTASGNPNATATTPLTITMKQPSPQAMTCNATVTDSYGESVQIAAGIRAEKPAAWPAGVQFPETGATLPTSGCAKNQPRALDGNGWTSADVVTGSDPFGFGLSTDGNGCLYYRGQPVDDTNAAMPSVAVSETGYSGLFSSQSNCGASLTAAGWRPSQMGPVTGASYASSTGSVTCSLIFTDQFTDGTPATQAAVAAQVASPCTGTCYALLSGSVDVTWVQACGPKGNMSNGQCDTDMLGSGDNGTFDVETAYQSTDGGNTWKLYSGSPSTATGCTAPGSYFLLACMSRFDGVVPTLPAGATFAYEFDYSETVNRIINGTPGELSTRIYPYERDGTWTPSKPPSTTGMQVH